jgi:hypothetical protein
MQAYCCKHLRDLEVTLREMNLRIQHDGRTWWQSDKPGHWVYFDCYLVPASLRERFDLPAFVEHYAYDGKMAGQESGFRCNQCHSAVVGVHERYSADVPHVS